MCEIRDSNEPKHVSLVPEHSPICGDVTKLRTRKATCDFLLQCFNFKVTLFTLAKRERRVFADRSSFKASLYRVGRSLSTYFNHGFVVARGVNFYMGKYGEGLSIETYS